MHGGRLLRVMRDDVRDVEDKDDDDDVAKHSNGTTTYTA